MNELQEIERLKNIIEHQREQTNSRFEYLENIIQVLIKDNYDNSKRALDLMKGLPPLDYSPTAKPQQAPSGQAAKTKHYNYTMTTEQQQLMFNKLKESGYIAPDTDFNSFCFAISGTPIKTKFKKINWIAEQHHLNNFITIFLRGEPNNKQKAFYCFVVNNEPINIKSLTNSVGDTTISDADFQKLKKRIVEDLK